MKFFSTFFIILSSFLSIQAQCSFDVNIGSDTLICQGNNFTLNAGNADSSNVSYTWNTGDTTRELTVSTQGIFWVDVTINSCTERDSIIINSISTPNLSIDSFNVVCEGIPSNIYFTVDDTANVEYSWNYGDGTILNTDSIIIQKLYNSAGSYWVTLQASRNECSSDLDSINIIVLEKPIVDISTNVSEVCIGTSTVINNNSLDSTGASYEWNFGDGSSTLDTSSVSTISYNYTISDSFYISARITNINGCTDKDSILTYVAPIPDAALHIINDTICENEPLLLLNTSTGVTGASTLFSLGDGSDIVQNSDTTEYYYNNFGSFQVTINIDNGICSEDTAFDSVYVKETPNVNLSATTVCFGDTTVFSLQLTDTLSPLVVWDFGDNTPLDTLLSNQNFHYYNGNGQNYATIVNVQNENNCYLTDTLNTVIDLKPTLDFTLEDVCQNDPSIVINNSIDTFQTIYHIDFGDNNTNQFIPTTYVYDTSGNYVVTILGTNNNSCPTDTFITTTTVKPIPFSNFSLSSNTICLGDSVLFTNNSIGINSTKYTWDFDDNTIVDSTTNQLKYFYSINGTIVSPKLIVDNQNGCLPDTSENTLIINSVPFLNFNINSVCYGDSTNIVNLSSGVGDSTKYIISFGDGTIQTKFGINTIKYLYNDDGSYPIDIFVDNQNGCETPTDTNVSVVKAVPVADFSAAPVCFGDSTIIYNNSIDIIDTTATYSWDFDDGELSDTAAASFKHLFDNGNGQVYQVSLVVDNNNGCSSSIDTQTIIVDSKPIANFTIDTICYGDSTTIINQSLGVEDTTMYVINFGDGSQIQTEIGIDTLRYFYDDNGSYPVTIFIDNQNGCATPTDTNISIVKAVPVANFSAATVCFGDSTVIIDNSFDIVDSTVSYFWDFDNGLTSDTIDNSFKYLFGNINGQTYQVSLTVNNNNGCADSIFTLPVQIDERPTALMTIDTAVCEPQATMFINQSNNTGSYTTLLLNYDDGTPLDTITHVQDTILYSYTNTQIYYISLTADNHNTCPIDTFLDTTELKLTPFIDLGATTVCYDNPTIFTDTSSHLDQNYNVLYYLNHGDGFTDTLTPFNNYAYTYGYNGKDYKAILTIDNRRGCTTTDSLNISVLKRPYLNYTVDTVCQNTPNTILNLTNDTTVTDSALYYIFYGDGTDSILSHRPFYNHTFDTCNFFLPYYNITINLDNGNSCTDAVNFKPAYVYCLPVVNFSGLESEYCFNDPFDGDNLIGTPQGGIFYPQSLFDPQIDTMNQTWAAYHPTDTGNNILVAYGYTDINNCTVIDSQLIDVVRTLPTFQINGLPPHLCKEGDTITISATVAGGFFNSNNQNIYIIEDTLVNDSIALFYPVDSITFGQVFYNYQDSFGCANVQVESFEVHELPDVYLGNDTIVPLNGFPFKIGAGVSPNYSYSWSTGATTDSILINNPANYYLTIVESYPLIPGLICIDSDSILVDIGSFTLQGLYHNNIQSYPNPVRDRLNIDINLPFSDELYIQIIDLQGRLINQRVTDIQKNILQNIQYDISEYAEGQYIIRISNKDFLIWQNVIQKY